MDSLQTARCEASDLADSQRARVDAVVSALKKAAKTRGLLVLATSEMARGFYRGGGVPGTDALASFKESGAIEYGVALALAMVSVKGESDLIDVVIPKNRMGQKLDLRLELDRSRAELREVAKPEVQDDAEQRAEARQAVADQRVERMKQELLRAFASTTVDITARRDLRELIRGDSGLRDRAITELLLEGRISGGKGRPFRLHSEAEQ